MPELSGQTIRTPTFRRFARSDSRESIRKKIPIFEALGQIRANHVFSPIRIEIRVIRVQSSLLSHSSEGQFAKKKVFSKRESIAESMRDSCVNRESIRANRPTKCKYLYL